jgi:hypothetical protein
MMTALVVGSVVLLVLLALVAAALTTKVVYQHMEAPLETRIAEHYKPDEVILKDLKANSFGLKSSGVWQVRGNGGLVLTEKTLHFFMFLPKRDICIPLTAITELSLTKSHLGKATIYNLLKVQFSADGGRDSIAWYVTDPQAWKCKIEQIKPKAAL